MSQIDTPINQCPQCHHMIDAATAVTGLGDEIPDERDASICAYCFAVLKFNKDLTVRLITQSEWDQLTAEQKTAIAQIKHEIN